MACLAGAAVLTALSHSAPPVAAPTEQLSLVLERIPFEAQNALARGRQRFRRARQELGAAEDPDLAAGKIKLEPALGKFSAAMASVADARASVETIQTANQETRELAPKLLSELGDLASAVGVQKLEGMSRYLERFELAVQRIQQELNGMASGVSDAAPTAQRLADSLEFLNQVMRGLSGEESGMALSRVTGADAEQRLKTVVQRNQQYAASVRKAIGAAETLSKAQTAARTLPALASGMNAQIGEAAGRARRIGRRLQDEVLALLAAAAVLLARARVAVPQIGQCPAHERGSSARERAQPGSHHAPAR